MLVLPATLHDQIRAHGVATYPHEGCGLLLGEVRDGANVARDARSLPNVWPAADERPERFRIDPADWLAVELDAAAEGLDVIGIFHSHPDHPPIASPRDVAWAAFAGYSYLITQIVAGQPGPSRSWQLAADRSGFLEETIQEA